MESCSDADIGDICPVDELAELQTLLQEALDNQNGMHVLQRIEDGLKRIVARMEEAGPVDAGKTPGYTLLLKSS
jgi:DNA polymerase I-like protein with 3'-5' exonuclease and polymerase domains